MKVETVERYEPERHWTQTKYIASDGEEFATEKECLNYEDHIRTMQHPVFKSRVEHLSVFPDGTPATLYYLRDESDFVYLVQKLYIGHNLVHDFNKRGRGWYIYYTTDGGDYSPDTHWLYNYFAYEDEIEKDFEDWKKRMRYCISQVDKSNE